MKRIVLTAIGKDRPGIVAAVTEVLYKNKCNIEDSSMTILEGEFAMILIFSAPPAVSVKKLESDFQDAGKRLDLLIQLKDIEISKRKTPEAASQHMYMISLLGTDQPGLVYRVAKVLADQNINITDVNTKQMGSEANPLYAMLLEVELPSKSDPESVRKELENLGKQLHAEITIKPLDVLQL